jgi:hypothetical protein
MRIKPFMRCPNPGGMSTGPKTAEGIERIRRAVTKHGRYAKSVAEAKRESNGDQELLAILSRRERPFSDRIEKFFAVLAQQKQRHCRRGNRHVA